MIYKDELNMFLFVEISGTIFFGGAVLHDSALASQFIAIAYPFLAWLSVIPGNENFWF